MKQMKVGDKVKFTEEAQARLKISDAEIHEIRKVVPNRFGGTSLILEGDQPFHESWLRGVD